MEDLPDFSGWRNNQNAEDFAEIVNRQLGDRPEGLVRVPFEDFTLPDHVVLGGNFEAQGHVVRWIQLLGGALEHFHGIRASEYRAVPTEAPPMTPFSMALEMTVSRPETATDA